ncbi:hypothetical protein ACWGN9_05970 [Streptomyces sp. NPDC055775]
MSTNQERTCETCPAILPPRPSGARGPAPRFCNDCKRRQHNDRSTARYTRKGYPKTRPEAWRHKPGDTFGSLTLVERLGKRNGSQWVTAECACPGRTVKEYNLSNLINGVTVNCADREHHADPRAGRFQGDVPAYGTVHNWVAAKRGRAKDHPCLLCGATAAHWAYLHGAPDQLLGPAGTHEDGMPYAVDVEQYEPMCRSCHRRWDNARASLPAQCVSLAHVALFLVTHDAEAAEAA